MSDQSSQKPRQCNRKQPSRAYSRRQVNWQSIQEINIQSRKPRSSSQSVNIKKQKNQHDIFNRDGGIFHTALKANFVLMPCLMASNWTKKSGNHLPIAKKKFLRCKVRTPSKRRYVGLYPKVIATYGQSLWSFRIEFIMGGRLFGGGSLGRINKQAKRSAKLIMPALIRVVVLNPRPEENKLFIMIGWTTAPTADPAEAKVIAKVRFFLKYSERTAMLGTYIMPPANPIPIP